MWTNLGETFLKRNGLAFYLSLKCENCGYFIEFYTSISNDNSLDNVRTVYSMRPRGQGYAGLEKLTDLWIYQNLWLQRIMIR